MRAAGQLITYGNKGNADITGDLSNSGNSA